MPLFSDLSNISQYYSGGSSSLNYLAGPYAGHSSIVAANYRTPPSTYKPSSRVFNRGYKPHLATISENLPSRAGLSRINSPKLLYHNSPKYTKPISINTADIDVSSNRYRHNVDRINVSTSPRTSSSLSSSPKSSFRETNTEDNNPKLEDDSNEVFMPRIDKNFRSTIKRERTVVRFHTNRNYDHPVAETQSPTTKKVFDEPVKVHKPSWREAFEPEELSSPKKKAAPQKPLSERLIEKFLIKEKEELEDPLWRAREEERRRQREENLMNFDGECKIQRRASRRKSIKKSFHDICRTISSETIDEDLNPGQPMLRRNTRKKSDYDIMKAIRRDSAEINHEEILLLDELIKQECLDEKRPEPPPIEEVVPEPLEDEVEINEEEIKRRKKFTKKKSNEKLIEDDQEEQPKTTPPRRKIVKKKTSGSLDKAIEAITPKEPVETEPLKMEEDLINTTPQKRKIIKKKTSTNLDKTIEAITPKEPPVEVPQSLKLVPKISGTVEIETKPNLKLVIDDIKVEETVMTASSPTAKKFKYNVIIEEIKSPGIETEAKMDLIKIEEPKILEINNKNEVAKVDLISKPKQSPTNDIKTKVGLKNDILVKKSIDLPKQPENKTQKSGIKLEDIKTQVLDQKSIELPKEKVVIKLEPILKQPLEPNKLDKPLVENKNPVELTKELEKHLPNKPLTKLGQKQLKTEPVGRRKQVQKQENLDELDIDNFWEKMGKRETIYYKDRRKYLNDCRERERQKISWVPEEIEEETPKDSIISVEKQVEPVSLQKKEVSTPKQLTVEPTTPKLKTPDTPKSKEGTPATLKQQTSDPTALKQKPANLDSSKAILKQQVSEPSTPKPKQIIVDTSKSKEPVVLPLKQQTSEPSSPKQKQTIVDASKPILKQQVSEPSTPKPKQTISDTSKSKEPVVPPLKQQTSEPTSPKQKQTIVDTSKPILKQQVSEPSTLKPKQTISDTSKSKEPVVPPLKQQTSEPSSPKQKQTIVDASKPILKQQGSEPLSPKLKQAVVDTPKSKESVVLPLKQEESEPLSPKLKQAVVDTPKSNKVPVVPTLKEQGSEPLSPKQKQAVLDTPKSKEVNSIQKKNELDSPKVKSVEKLPEPLSPKQKQAVVDAPKPKEVDSTQKKNELGPSKVKQVDKVAEPVSPKQKQAGEVSKQKVLASKLEPQSPKLKQPPKTVETLKQLDETPSKLKLDDVPKPKAKPKPAPKQKEAVKSKVEDKLKKLSFKYTDLELESMRGEIVEMKVETQQPKIDFILEEKYDPVLKPNEDITIPTAEEYAKTNPRKEPPPAAVTEENKPFVPLQSNVLAVPKKPKPQWFDECPVVIMATPRDLRKRVLPHRQQKPQPKVTYVSDSSDDSSDEDSSGTDSSGGSDEYDTNVVFNQGGKVGGNKWKSTSSNDSGFDSSAPGSPANNRNKIEDCDVNCHKKCEKLTANLCGVNQKLIVEALSSVKKGSSNTSTGSSDSPSLTPAHNPAFVLEPMEASSAYSAYQRSGRVTPPATSIPRFRKYAVEDFCFLKVLGKGSFGKVMLAELRNTEYYYAVKCLKKDIVLEDDDVECTLIERKVLALGTKHPYLCHLFCTFQTESHLFFVMEYLNGGDLMFHIQVSGRFPEPRAKFYGAEIVSGLKFLHSKGIVYRDLKLDNILLDFDGHVRIADFGMCKLQIFLDRTADTFCGTPDYMAPEIIKGQHYNQGVDWWSFGVLLYEMLIGQSPFSGCDEDELFWSICNERPVIPVFLSREANQILTLLLEKDSAKRLGNKYCPAGDIVDIPFFKQIDWGMLERRQLEAPFKPKVQHPLDTQYFDKAFTAERVKLTPIEKDILHSMDQTQFHGFSYTNPNATDK